mmetsp:Transcript_99938/g.279944  ORF Transcript_99938/g.279944 Transcript_99938/m.279944 type:complete len:257 (+) Transcript_99938:44-814(+)
MSDHRRGGSHDHRSPCEARISDLSCQWGRFIKRSNRMLMGPSAGVHSSASAEDVPLRGCARDGLAVPAEVKKCLLHPVAEGGRCEPSVATRQPEPSKRRPHQAPELDVVLTKDVGGGRLREQVPSQRHEHIPTPLAHVVDISIDADADGDGWTLPGPECRLSVAIEHRQADALATWGENAVARRGVTHRASEGLSEAEGEQQGPQVVALDRYVPNNTRAVHHRLARAEDVALRRHALLAVMANIDEAVFGTVAEGL